MSSARPLALGVALAAGALVAIGCGERREPRPASVLDRTAGVDGLCASVARRDAVVLGRGRAPDDTRVTLHACGASCLILRGLPGGERGCAVAPSRRAPPPRDPLGGGAFVQLSPRHRIELFGEASAAVRRVVVRFRDGRQVRRRRATLIAARHRPALRAAGAGRPFGVFVAFVPAGARAVVAEAYDGDGRIGSLRFDPILESLHPRVFVLRTTSGTPAG